MLKYGLEKKEAYRVRKEGNVLPIRKSASEVVEEEEDDDDDQ